jgi:ParB-like chromosome segregation protein Spo0J
MIRDRIRELRRVPSSSLRPNPRNWRSHPPAQQAALKGILAEIGFADALLVRELADGSLEIVDGHLRAETTPDDIVPVLVLDVSADEAAKILATHDAITEMALPDFNQLRPLLDECDFNSPAISTMFAELEKLAAPLAATRPTVPLRAPLPAGASRLTRKAPRRKTTIPDSYQVVVTCDDEAQQRQVYEQLTAEGRQCRLLML